MLKLLTTIAAAMLAAGVVLPYAVGTALPSLAYNILQIGGLAGLIVFGLPHSRRLRRERAASREKVKPAG